MSNSISDDPPAQLGWLLVQIGTVSQGDVERALKSSLTLSLPLGQALVLRESVSSRILKLALEAQWMIRDGVLAEANALEAFEAAKRNNWALSDALISLGMNAHDDTGARLGELLVGAGIVEKSVVLEQLRLASVTGLPLGRVMVLSQKASEGTVWHALKLQRSVRSGQLTLEQAVELLAKIQSELSFDGFRLGELLIAARRLSRDDVQRALDTAMKDQSYVGDVLVAMGCIEPDLLRRALVVQRLLRLNRLQYDDAVEQIRDSAAALDLSLFDEPVGDAMSFYGLLRLNGYFSKAKLEHVVDALSKQKRLLSTVVDSHDAIRLKKPGTVGEALALIFQDTEALLEMLNTVVPSDREFLLTAKQNYDGIINRQQSVEEALMQMVRAVPVR